MLGDLKDLFASTLVTDLSPALHPLFAGKIPSWVQPGKVAWDWWAYEKTGSLERQKRYVDAAAEFSWSYILVDANWHLWNNSNPEPMLKELLRYAKKQGVGVFLWYNSGGKNNSIQEGPRGL